MNLTVKLDENSTKNLKALQQALGKKSMGAAIKAALAFMHKMTDEFTDDKGYITVVRPGTEKMVEIYTRF